MRITKKLINELSYKIVGCAIEVHNILGPGLLESIYEECLYEELKSQGLFPKRQVPVPVYFKGKKVKKDFRVDLLVNDLIIVELKAVNDMHPIFEAKLLTYMKLAEKPKGLIINFHFLEITNDLIPMVNEIFAKLPER